MSNPDGNPDIADCGSNTRFSSDWQPGAPNKPWSVRNATRRLAAAEFEGAVTAEAMRRVLVGREQKNPTGAQMLAISRFLLALAGDARMSQHLTDDIDGKLTDMVHVKNDPSDMPDEELDTRITELLAQR